MSQSSRVYQQEKERLQQVLTNILGEEEAAGWVVQQNIDKVDELRQRFPEKTVALVSFDVDKIKEFVFSTTKPLEIQGASALVSDLTESNTSNKSLVDKILESKGLTRENKLFAGGGTGLLIVPKEKGQEIASEIQNQFAKETLTGSCTTVLQEFALHELIVGSDTPSIDNTKLPSGTIVITKEGRQALSFGEVFRQLADRLRESKEEKLFLPLPPLPGILHRCQSCGVEAASEWDKIQVEEIREELPDRICETCSRKRKKGRDERKKLKDTPFQTALSIDNIAGAEERGYLAVLHADANNMGRLLSQLPSMADYAVFSRTVDKVMREVAKDIVREHNLTNCYQAPIIGGDDILLIIPAQKVAGVAKDLMEKIKEKFARAAGEIGGDVASHLKKVGMSLGFVIVPSHFAIRFATDYAETLLHSAKEKRYETEEDCLDYLVIKDASPLIMSISDLRRLHFRREALEWTLALTDKPVTVSKFREMLDDVKNLQDAGVAQSQLHQTETLLMQETPKVAALNMRYQWLQVESWRRFCHLKGYGDVGHCIQASGILSGKHPDYRSSFLDLLELYEFRQR